MFQIPNQTAKYTIILANIIPIFGIIYWGWTPFYVFWLFWIETLIVAFFNAIKIIVCKGDEIENSLPKINLPFTETNTENNFNFNNTFKNITTKSEFTPTKAKLNQKSHWGIAIKYVIIRCFIFGFYSIFIIVFLGFMSNTPENSLKTAQVLAFQNQTFNFTLIAFFLNQFVQFFSDFILNDNYKKTHPYDFTAIFDGRQLVIHIAVVFGGVVSQFLFKGSFNHITSMIVVVSIFCVVKTFYDLWILKGNKNIFNTREFIDKQGR